MSGRNPTKTITTKTTTTNTNKKKDEKWDYRTQNYL